MRWGKTTTRTSQGMVVTHYLYMAESSYPVVRVTTRSNAERQEKDYYVKWKLEYDAWRTRNWVGKPTYEQTRDLKFEQLRNLAETIAALNGVT